MLTLKDILKVYLSESEFKLPVISNAGWSLDVFSPKDIYVIPEANVQLLAGFGLDLPYGIGGLISPKRSAPHFSVSPGQLIHPQDDCQLQINLIYHGRSETVIKAGEPLCQIVFQQRELIQVGS